MPPRALIVGIEHYPAAEDLAQTIADASKNAQEFFEWLTTVKHVSAADAYVCTTDGVFAGARRFGTEREAIVDAIEALVAVGQDQTDELFVYFSGHGYGFKESQDRRAVDLLIASDYQKVSKGGIKSLQLQEIQEKLYAILGGAHHYYFVDACRTLIDEDAISPVGLGRVLGHAAQRGRPTKYTLYSTAYGTTAAINSGFGPALIEGLHGKGHAKGFAPTGSLYVMFPLLCSYVQSRIRNQRLDQNKDGNGEGYIVEVLPIPNYTCTIEVEGAAPTDTFEATLSVAGNPAMSQKVAFSGPTFALPFTPGDFVLQVAAAGAPLIRVDPPAGARLEFWDDCRATFRAPGAPAGAIPAAAPQPAGRTAETAAGAEPLDPVRASIVHGVGGDPQQGVVAFSESLGTMTNRELGLWLSIMGASRIVADPTTFSKMRALPLADITSIPPEASGLYVLGASHDAGSMEVTIAGKDAGSSAVPGLTGVFQALSQTSAGPQLVTIGVGRSMRTFASYCLANRLTLFVCSPGSRGQTIVNQYVLPMFHLQDRLRDPGGDRFREATPPLRVVRAAYTFQALFGRKREIDPSGQEERELWSSLLDGRWVDPILSPLACYEVVRRGDDAMKARVRDAIVPKLERSFPEISDGTAVAALLGMSRSMPPGPPLFREGLLAFPEWETRLPISADRLDFNHIWTAWRGPQA
jgi:hypothetical protein